jgi:hypothetical protein
MNHRCSLHLAVVALALYASSPSVHAGIVLLNNLDQSPAATSSSLFVGQSFIAGTMNETLYGAQMQLNVNALAPSGIVLEVESRNFDGTVGSTLDSNVDSSYDPATGLITFLANSHFELTAGTGYWLVLSDTSAGGVTWDFTASNVYQSEFGYGLPSYNTSWTSTADNGLGNSTYYQPSDGPQLFDLIAPTSAAVPEPPSWLLLCFPVAIAVLTQWFQGTRRGRPGHNHYCGSRLHDTRSGVAIPAQDILGLDLS